MITAEEAYAIKEAADVKAKEKAEYYLSDYCECLMELLPELIGTAARQGRSAIDLGPSTLTHTCYNKDFVVKFLERRGDELKALGYRITGPCRGAGPYDYKLSWNKKESKNGKKDN